jgi:hypothetical protein
MVIHKQVAYQLGVHTWVGVGCSYLPPIFSLQPSFLRNSDHVKSF